MEKANAIEIVFEKAKVDHSHYFNSNYEVNYAKEIQTMPLELEEHLDLVNVQVVLIHGILVIHYELD